MRRAGRRLADAGVRGASTSRAGSGARRGWAATTTTTAATAAMAAATAARTSATATAAANGMARRMATSNAARRAFERARSGTRTSTSSGTAGVAARGASTRAARAGTTFACAMYVAGRDVLNSDNWARCLERMEDASTKTTKETREDDARRAERRRRRESSQAIDTTSLSYRVKTWARGVQLAVVFSPLAFLAPVLLRDGWAWGNRLWYSLLRRTLEACGPAFIKWGQWASTRYDVFPAAMCHELEHLQAGAPEHSWAETKKILQRAYGGDAAAGVTSSDDGKSIKSFEDIFEWFDEKPLASGSVAQIHRARLKPGVAEEHLTATKLALRLTRSVSAGIELVMSGEISRAALGMLEEWRDGAAGLGREVERLVNGRIRRGSQKREVAVKVRHPGVVDALTRDFEILVWMASLSKSIKWLEPLQLENTIQQFGVHMLQQVDFRHEADNLDKFRKSFLLMPAVSFPTPIPGLATEEVLVETYEQGVSIASYLLSPEAAKEQLGNPQNKTLAGLGVKTLFKMLIDDNFLHADLHPGNILVRLPNGVAHTLSTIAGMRGKQSSSIKENDDDDDTTTLSDASPEIIILDTGLATRLTPFHQASLARMFQAIVTWDGSTVADTILSFADNVKANVDYTDFRRDIAVAVNQFQESTPRAGDCMGAIFETVQKYHLCLDPNVMIAVVTVMVLEGWQWRLDPTVNILDYLDDVLKASARKYARLAIADYAFRDMWAPFSEPNVFSKTAADPMNALRAQGDTHATSAVYGNLF